MSYLIKNIKEASEFAIANGFRFEVYPIGFQLRLMKEGNSLQKLVSFEDVEVKKINILIQNMERMLFEMMRHLSNLEKSK